MAQDEKLEDTNTFWSACFADELLKCWQAVGLHVENGGWPDFQSGLSR